MKIILFVLLLAVSPALFAQQAKPPLHEIWQKSLPFITNYTTDDYKAALQNWSLVQAGNGLMYAANNYGILEYDGSSWRLIKTTEGNPVRSLAKDPYGRIYTGGSGEIGYLAPDARNEMVFHSIKNKLDKRNWDFGNVWFTFADGKSVYFVCDLYILEWAGGKFNVWKSDIGTLGFSWLVHGDLYVSVSDRGLMKKEKEALVPIAGGGQFKGMGLMGLFPYDKTRMLAIGTSKEFFLYDGKKLEPFKRNGVNVKIPDAVYHGIQLSNGDYALATTGSGFYLMDREGNIKNNICRKEGLASDAVYAVFEDAEGDVWLATDNGISRLEINSPLRVLTDKHGLDENPFDIEFYNNTLYTANSKGLFQLNRSAPNGISKLSFKKLNGIDNLTLHCQTIGNEMIISNYDGIFALNKNGKMSMIAQENVVKVEESHTTEKPGHLMVGLEGYGITEIVHVNGQWKPGKKRSDVKVYAESFARASNGHVFLNSRRNGIYEMIWKKPAQTHTLADEFTLKHHHAANGLSADKIRSMERVGDDVYASTDLAVHRFNVAKGAFEKDSLLTALMAPYKGSWVNEMAEGRDNKLWMTLYHNYQSHIFYQNKGKISKLPVSGRFSDALITKIHDTRQGFVLFGSNKWVVLLDENKPILKSKPFKTLIRQVSINKDSLVSFRHNNERTNIQYGPEGLRFRFAMPGYDLSSKNEFQYFLEGYTDYWSNWSAETFVDFTNLPEGHYVFKVRGKNIYGEIGGEDTFTFNILPPWYRTWWANAAYVILLTGLTVLIIRFRERSLQREKMVLERTVQERTEKIMVQTEELKEMDRMKSRFFANISHEFRTPLTLILTPLEEELKKKPPAEREGLLIMKRYANRLVELVNQLLNLSKLDAGKMELQVQETDLRQFMSIISSSFDSLAQHKDIDFKRQLSISHQSSWIDPDKLEKILTNLLSNAFKFTPAGGAVTLTARNGQEQDHEFLFVELTDTGKGIPPEEQKRVFESFYQTRQTVENHEGGTGLGLALVKELVKLHNGFIKLQSEVGSGTTFSLKIPIGKAAYHENQLTGPANNAFAWQTSLALADSTALPELPPKPLETPKTEHRESILVVEDNPELRHYVCKLLEDEYLVYNAPEGKAAFEMAVRVMPNLIISDLMMPGMNGMELTAKIKSDERTSHIPVILLTAKSAQESRIEGLKTGADDYLTKPFSFEELNVRVRNLIQSRKKLAERFRERILVHVTPSDEVSLDDKFLLKAKDIVEANMEDVLFSVEKMAEEMSLSRTQLLRKLKALTALAPNDFIRDMRLQKAAEMIRKKADTITQIGYAVGFNDQSYFSKCFKKEFGETPTEYSARVSQKQV